MKENVGSMCRPAIVLLVVLSLLAAGCVDSLQKTGTGDIEGVNPALQAHGDVEGGNTSAGVAVPALQLNEFAHSGVSRNATDDQLPLPLPDPRQAHEAITGSRGDISRTVTAGGTDGGTNVTGSSSGSVESISSGISETDSGLAAPMPASGLGSFSEPGQSAPALPGSGSSTNSPPGAYYEGSGTDNTEFRNYLVPDCGCK
jgi:hypothetical protein